jgi:hypothetical protein
VWTIDSISASCGKLDPKRDLTIRLEVYEMLEMLDIGIKNAVAYRVGGKITEDEMKSVLSIFKEKIKSGEMLLIYQEIESVGGAELDAIIEKFKFFFEYGMSNFSRIAVVTHKKWMHKIIDLEDKLFKKIDMKGFLIDDKNNAIEFLRNGRPNPASC